VIDVRLPRLLDRHRAGSLLAGLALLAALFPAGPFGARARVAGFFRPLALLRPDPPAGPASADARLREEAAHLKAQVHELEAEVKALKEFRGLRLEEKGRVLRPILGSIVLRDRLWPDRLSVLLDRGTEDGVRRGLPVVAGRSLAGFVVEAGPRTCRVQLLDDPGPRSEEARVRIGVRVFRPGTEAAAEGVLFGERRGVLRVKMLPAGTVKTGDLVVTSAADASVPAGLLVGTVLSVDEDRRLRLATAEVRPSADLASLRSLAILVLDENDARPRSAKSR
jgi:rod shape-determining protein MreC